MTYQKNPDTRITTDQLLRADTLADYLTLKLSQLGIGLREAAAVMGYTSGIMLTRVIKGDVGAKAYRQEQICSLVELFAAKHKQLGLEPLGDTETALLQTLNDKLPRPKFNRKGSGSGRTLESDPSIKEAQLLETKSLGEYLELKRKQLGLTIKDIGESLGSEGQYQDLKDGKRERQFAPEAFERLVKKIRNSAMAIAEKIQGIEPLSDMEESHFRELHGKLKPYQPKAPKAEAPAVEEKSYDPRTLLSLREVDQKKHVVPSKLMLKALSTGQHEEWSALKKELMEKPENKNKRLFLRGFLCGTVRLNDMDLSQCDLVRFSWPRDPSRSVPASLKDSLLTANGSARDVENAYYKLDLSLRLAYERENPDARFGQPQPVNTVNEIIKESTLVQARVRGK